MLVPDNNETDEALREAIELTQPRLAVCGHIYESWGCQSQLDGTPVRNLGPGGTWLRTLYG